MKLLLDLQGAQTESRFRGIGRQNRALARAIVANPRGHDVHLLLNRRLDETIEDLSAEFEPLVGRANIHVFEVPGAVAERDAANLWRTRAAELIREAAIAAIDPDVLHVGSLFEGYVDDAVTSIGALAQRHATAVTLHDLIPLATPDRYLREPSVRRHWLRRAQALKRADLLLSVSHFSRQEAELRLSIPAERIAVISAGVDAKFGAADAPPDPGALARFDIDRPFILYVGAIDPRKNVELIFAAVAKLPPALRDSRLIVFAGWLFDDEIGQLKLGAARAGIAATQLRFCRHVTDDQLAALYRRCDAFVFPSTFEGFGMPPLEAMAAGAPTLAAAATSLHEVVGNPDLMFDPHDAGALATKLARMFEDDAFREEAGRYGVARAAEFSWQSSAERALDALEDTDARRREALGRAPILPLPARKPRLAFLSPLPGERSGIADYAAELLPELACFYEIECIVEPGVEIHDDWVLANFTLRDRAYFERNAVRYDRVLYAIGNSRFHANTLELVRRYPGVVMLHDVFLSDLIDWMAGEGMLKFEDVYREIYRSHGLTGLLLERDEGRRKAVEQLPCNQLVVEAASGLIVHSNRSADQLRDLYSGAPDGFVTVIPHLRALPAPPDRAAARARLGVPADVLLVCSFGVITARKRSRAIVDAWTASDIGGARNAHLALVGENAGGDYGDALEQAIAGRADIRLTGFASAADYRDYLAAADLAIQLRGESRGETSGTVLDCLAIGLPVIVNAHGTLAELPNDIVCKLDDAFTHDALVAAIERMIGDRDATAAQAQRGRDYVREHHHPARIGSAIRSAIEGFHDADPARIGDILLDALADAQAPVAADKDDLVRVSEILARRAPRPRARQILYDVTVLAEQDAKTGIQRVVRSLLLQLIASPPAGYRIEPIRIDAHQYRYARQWTSATLDLPSWLMGDEPVEYQRGDIFLGIDWVPDRLPAMVTWLEDFRRAGGRIVIGVHDLLPFHLPSCFPDFMPNVARRWFETVLRTADQIVCVSRSVADDVARFGTALRPPNREPLAIDYFHNAADLEASLPSSGWPDDGEKLLAQFGGRPSLLMVGTIEPRKRHAQVLAGFERLWREGVDVNLVIVGKQGWMMDELAERIMTHPEHDARLFWLEGISDEFLDEVYAVSSALIAASLGEGFGLPLIEAARRGCALIARDIEVFREVAGDHALYFSGEGGDAIEEAIRDWLRLEAEGKVPNPGAMAFQTWRESAQQLCRALFADQHYRLI